VPDDIAPEKLSAYLGTHFRYSALGQEITLRIGQHSPETQLLARKLGHDCAVFITAYNPMVRIPRDGEQGFRVKMNGIPEGREHDSTGT